MKSNKIKYLIILFLIIQSVFSQNIFRTIVKDDSNGFPLTGVNIFLKSINTGGTTDTTGFAEISGIPNGLFTISFSYIGYSSNELSLSFPLENPHDVVIVYLKPVPLKLKGITVTTTRTNNRIENSPIRVEILGREEVNEEIAIRPGNISKLLGETSGIQIQQTSLTSGNISFRIQGLPGQYTQLLKDGFPIYSGFSSGLSLLQIPPLDLEQVEVIKGSSSALYGGDAIAGIVNLVSKTPHRAAEWTVLLNQTHKSGRDIGTYYSRRNDKVGITLLASMSEQKAFDVNGDNFTDLQRFNQFTLNPKIFYYFDDATFLVGSITSSFENREGGDIIAIEKAIDSLHTFVEINRSNRFITQLKFEKKFPDGNVLSFKNSMNYYKRDFSKNSFNINGFQLSSYSEFSFLVQKNLHNIVAGLSFITDNFKQENNRYGSVMNNSFFTSGVFIQDDWNVNDNYILQTGVRTDYHNEYGFFLLPRLSILYKPSTRFYIRAGGGLGYKTPTTFIDEVVSKSFNSVSPIPSTIKSESSHSETIDVNYNTIISNNISFTINQALYYTQLFHPVIPKADSLANKILVYENANGSIVTTGYDTNVHITCDELGLFVDYTYTHAQKDYDSKKSILELTPANKINITLTYEEEDDWRTGIEAFYTGKQFLNDQTQTRDYWTFGLMMEKMLKHLSVLVNVENIFDVRQTKFEDVVIPPYDNPTFRELWAPLDGIVANVALKIQL